MCIRDRSYTDDLSATYDEREKDVLQATVSWPFQFGGKNKSNVNKNLQVKGMKKLLLENAFRNNTQGVTAAWSTLESSKSLLRAVQSQVKAAEIATPIDPNVGAKERESKTFINKDKTKIFAE